MTSAYWFVVACGIVALVYGAYATRSVLAASAGTPRMQEIAAAVQEGASAYLKRQYMAIAVVGAVIGVGLGVALGFAVSVGFFIGAILSGAVGYMGMNVSVRANVRTADAARSGGLAPALAIAFKSGAITGMLVVVVKLSGKHYHLLQIVIGRTVPGISIEERHIKHGKEVGGGSAAKYTEGSQLWIFGFQNTAEFGTHGLPRCPLCLKQCSGIQVS